MHPTQLPRFSCLLALATLAATPAWSATPEPIAPPVLRIGQERYDADRFEALARALQANQHTALSGRELPDAVIQNYVQSRLLAAQARNEGLERDPQVAARLQVQTDQVLAEAERRRLMAAVAIDPTRTRAYFDRHPGDFDEFQLRHILIAVTPAHPSRDGTPRDDAQALALAQELHRQLLNGTDFAALARNQSDDDATAGDGGELSPLFGRYLADEFSAAVRALTVGEVSAPVKSAAGYHLIQLERRRVLSLAEAQPMIEAQFRSDAVDTALADLVRQHPVTLDRRALPAPSASPAQ